MSQCTFMDGYDPTYATQSLPLSKSDIVEMDKLQAKLIKSVLGFTKYYRTTPLLKAMNVNKIANLRNIYTINLLKSLFTAKSPYCIMI